MASAKWETTLKNVSRSIVSLRVNYVRSFDGEGPDYSLATGFIVDADRGIILTNRHVVTAGPVRGVATFLNKEEVPEFIETPAREANPPYLVAMF